MEKIVVKTGEELGFEKGDSCLLIKERLRVLNYRPARKNEVVEEGFQDFWCLTELCPVTGRYWHSGKNPIYYDYDEDVKDEGFEVFLLVPISRD